MTTLASFSTTTPEVVTLSAQGLLTGIAPGRALLRVDYQQMWAQADVPVYGPDITGFVHEGNGRGVCLADARVDVRDASQLSTTADREGRFTFPDVQRAGYVLMITKPGYTTAQVTLPPFPRNPAVDIAMVPTARIVDRVWDGTFAPDQCDYSNLQGGKRSFFFTATAEGVLVINRVEMQVLDIGGWSLFRGADRLAPECLRRPGTSYSIARGVQYELQVRGFGCGPNPPYANFYDGSFHVEFSRPE